MKIAVIGTGYVGLVQGVILAEFGMQAICVDVDSTKIKALNSGIIPIYEPGLKEIMDKNVACGRLHFSTDIAHAITQSKAIFIAVGTPPQEDGSADLKHVIEVANKIGDSINSYKVIINKSTVPVGTGELVRQTIQKRLNARDVNLEFDIVSNPEFLQEGKAINGCLNPDRVVIGADSTAAIEIMKKIYHSHKMRDIPFVITDIKSAEMIKYAANAFLAVKISFINEISRLAEACGANTSAIAHGMGLDPRIAPDFLQCGPGYGGSCFPKDTKAIVNIAEHYGESLKIIEAAIIANDIQKQRMVEKIIKNMGNLSNKTITILGLSFKPDTDDMRDAPALYIIPELIKQGANIHTYCPEGMSESKWRLKDYDSKITYYNDEYQACNGADAVVILTQWNRFSSLDLSMIKQHVHNDYFFDLRNVFVEDKQIRNMFKYFPVGQ
ncbi:MAG: UDP-glucose/GDP-mannose dehydrogenase family protein [Burkholderiales bacterium]|nr:UDP-glucose/GDP-mannose dehydrogenase family protein [Burkholderiales bacterium]